MNIKYRQLKAFSLASQALSFTAAAQAFAVTQASFSNLIKELEGDLGVTLFDRTTRRCTLTDAGKTFHDNLAPTLEHLENLYQQMTETGQGKRGRLAIAALPSMMFGFIPEVVAKYKHEFPNVAIVLNERRNDEVLRAVREKEVELGLGSLLRKEKDIQWVPMFKDRLVLIVPQKHELAGKQISWRTLESYPYIMMGTGPAEHAMRVHNLQIKPVFEVAHVATAVAMVRNGIGVTALPSSVIPALNLDGVEVASIAGRMATRSLGVLYRKDLQLTKVAATFVDMLRGNAAPSL